MTACTTSSHLQLSTVYQTNSELSEITLSLLDNPLYTVFNIMF